MKAKKKDVDPPKSLLKYLNDPKSVTAAKKRQKEDIKASLSIKPERGLIPVYPELVVPAEASRLTKAASIAAKRFSNYAGGGMIKRADGSYSRRGLWDNIRANKGSGKKPTKQMLAQEKKIKNEG